MAVVQRNVEINAPEHLTRRERARDTLVTAVLWAFYLYLWAPLASLLAWLLGFELAYDAMIRQGGLVGLRNEIGAYFIAILGIFAVVTAWSLGNRLRFRGKERRTLTTPPVSDTELAQHFDVAETQIWQLRAGRCIDVAFRDDGEKPAISVQPRR